MSQVRGPAPLYPSGVTLVEGELVQGAVGLSIRYYVPGGHGDNTTPRWHHARVQATLDVFGEPLYVGLWPEHGWPRFAAWAR